MSSIGALDIHEVALALKIDEDSVARLVLEGEIAAAKLNDEWIFLQEDIVAFLRMRISHETAERRGATKSLEVTSTITRVSGRGRGPRLTQADVDAIALEALALERAKMVLKK